MQIQDLRIYLSNWSSIKIFARQESCLGITYINYSEKKIDNLQNTKLMFLKVFFIQLEISR